MLLGEGRCAGEVTGLPAVPKRLRGTVTETRSSLLAQTRWGAAGRGKRADFPPTVVRGPGSFQLAALPFPTQLPSQSPRQLLSRQVGEVGTWRT